MIAVQRESNELVICSYMRVVAIIPVNQMLRDFRGQCFWWLQERRSQKSRRGGELLVGKAEEFCFVKRGSRGSRMGKWTCLHQWHESLDGWLRSPVENDKELSCKLFSSKLSMGYESTLFSKCISTSEHDSGKGYKATLDVRPNTWKDQAQCKHKWLSSSPMYYGHRAKSVGTQLRPHSLQQSTSQTLSPKCGQPHKCFHNTRHSDRNSQLDAPRRRNMPSAHLSYAGDLESHELSDNFEVDCTKGVVFLDRKNIVSGHCHLSIPYRLTWTGWEFLSGCDAVDCVCGKFNWGSYGWFFFYAHSNGKSPTVRHSPTGRVAPWPWGGGCRS